MVARSQLSDEMILTSPLIKVLPETLHVSHGYGLICRAAAVAPTIYAHRDIGIGIVGRQRD